MYLQCNINFQLMLILCCSQLLCLSLESNKLLGDLVITLENSKNGSLKSLINETLESLKDFESLKATELKKLNKGKNVHNGLQKIPENALKMPNFTEILQKENAANLPLFTRTTQPKMTDDERKKFKFVFPHGHFMNDLLYHSVL